LTFNEHDLTFIQERGFDIVSLPDAHFISDTLKVGEPMMPVKAIRVLLPSSTAVRDVRFISRSEITLEGEYYIFPIQYPVLTDGGQREFVEPKPEVYASEEDYPGKAVEFVSESYFREYHLAEILVYPLQYVPVRRKLTLSTELTFEIEYTASTPVAPRLRENAWMRTEIREKLRKMIANPEDLPSGQGSSGPPSRKIRTEPLHISSVPSALESQNVDYVIITSDALAQAFQRLANWKTKKGLVATVRTTSWVAEHYPGCDLQEKVRHFIQDAHMKWGTEYVLIGGDVDIIPGRINVGQDYHPVTDLYYSAIFPISDNWNADGDHLLGEWNDGADYSPDVFVGRAPVHTSSEASAFIDKVFTYERNSLASSLPSPEYLTKMLNLAGIVHYYNWGWWEVGLYAKYMTSLLVEEIHPHIDQYNLLEWDPSWAQEYHLAYERMDDYLDRANVIHQMNRGYGIVNHIDHSG
jgi:hypothetical protein